MAKNFNHFSINIHKIKTIFLAFQFWALIQKKKKVIIYINWKIMVASLKNLTLKSLANASLHQILLPATKQNMSIKLK